MPFMSSCRTGTLLPESLTIHEWGSQEPFVSGIPEMIDSIVANISNAEKRVRLLFASEPFPDKGEGWLCPAFSLYFPEAPARLYTKAEAL